MAYIGNTPGVSSQRFVQRETVSGSAKSLFVVSSGYSLGYVDVFVNGAQLDESDFTATDGVSVTLGTAAAVGDIVRIIAWLPRGLSDGYLKSEADARYLQLTGGALTGALTSSGSFSTSSANGYNVQLSGGNAYRMYATTNDLVFRSVTAGSDVMTLTYGGNVGIGTSSLNGTYAPKLQVESSASNGTGGIFIGSYMPTLTLADYSASAAYGQIRQDGNNFQFIADVGDAASNSYMTWCMDGPSFEKMRLDVNGNLGLGVTPSAWSASARAFQFGAYGSLFQDASGYPGLAFNAFQNTSNSWTYRLNDVATRYSQTNGAHQWFTAPSGTAGNAISFTQAMTLTAAGNLGIGNSSPNALFVVGASQTRPDSGVYAQISGGLEICATVAQDYRAQIETDSSTFYIGSNSYYSGGWNVYDTNRAPANITLTSESGNSYIAFRTSTSNSGYPAERARIDSSGNLLVGTTSSTFSISPASTGFQVQSTGQIWPNTGYGVRDNIVCATTGTVSGSHTYISFYSVGANKGSITTNGTTVAYNTSSDYRLKENIQPMTGALAKVAALKPCTYKWKADGSEGEGFIAHELAEVVPQCVTGEKDAVDAEGKPQYQGIDTSFLVATLTAAIQELKAIVDAQAERIAVLENA